MSRSSWTCLVAGAPFVAFLTSASLAQNQDRSAGSEASTSVLSFATYRMQDPQTAETTHVETEFAELDWEINGPVFLRAATPEPPGELIIKNIFRWEHEDESDDDNNEYEYELEIEYGLVEDHELIFEMPWQIGDGRVDGNGDVTLGWHWRLWKETDSLPAFALRNYVRIPSGIDSSGVDYELRGLISKTIADRTRLHLNPFGRSVNGNNEEEAEHFQYGIAIGFDHFINEEMLLIADYIYSSGEEEEDNASNHEAEFGLDWSFADNQKLGLAVLVGLDGDNDGPDFGAAISYMFSFGEE